MEPLKNIRLVHESCSAKMRSNYSHIPPDFIVGKYAKLAFKDDNGMYTEHMWIKVFQYDKGKELFSGVLDNDPVIVTHIICGDKITFSIDKIESLLDGNREIKGENHE